MFGIVLVFVIVFFSFMASWVQGNDVFKKSQVGGFTAISMLIVGLTIIAGVFR